MSAHSFSPEVRERARRDEQRAQELAFHLYDKLEAVLSAQGALDSVNVIAMTAALDVLLTQANDLIAEMSGGNARVFEGGRRALVTCKADLLARLLARKTGPS